MKMDMKFELVPVLPADPAVTTLAQSEVGDSGTGHGQSTSKSQSPQSITAIQRRRLSGLLRTRATVLRATANLPTASLISGTL